MGWEPVSIVHYTRPRCSIDWPTPDEEATVYHVNCDVVYPESIFKIIQGFVKGEKLCLFFDLVGWL